MSQSYFNSRTSVPQYIGGDTNQLQKIVHVVNKVAKGGVDCTLSFTLAANAASSTVSDSRISNQTCVVLMPTTAHAAAELASGNLYVAPGAGSAVVSHTKNSQTDRTFTVALIG